jgi:hypothetical protein
VNISGSFSTEATLENVGLLVSCSTQGTIAISQTGNTFTGTFDQTGTCTSPAGTVDNSGPAPSRTAA